MSFFRYPGGKAKLSKPILQKIQEITKGKEITTYLEPFFGGGSIGLKVLEENIFPNLQTVALNDYDFGIWCLWDSVYRDPEKLKRLVSDFTPTVEAFYDFKDKLLNNRFKFPIVEIGFMKLAIHQMSYSGLGTKAGGPIGGVKQASKYGVNCRWSPNSILKKIDKYHELFCRYKILTWVNDFEEFLFAYASENSFAYIDPPYFGKGNDLYQFSFNAPRQPFSRPREEDHSRLANQLKTLNGLWLLSYDDCPEIRELYSWATIEEISVIYTIKTARTKNELLIYPKQ